MTEGGWNPAELISLDGKQSVVKQAEDVHLREAPTGTAEANGNPEEPEKSRKGRILAICAGALVLVGGAGAFLLLQNSGSQPPAPAPAASTPAPLQSETATPTTTPSEVASEAPAIKTISQTVVVEFAPYSDALTPAAKTSLTGLAKQSIADNESVVVSGYVARDGNSENDKELSLRRAQAVADLLESQGVPNPVVLAEGAKSAALDKANAGALKRAGISHNRVAFVSAAVIQEN